VKHAELYITDYEQTYSEAGLEQSRLWPAGTLCITIAANIADTAILGMDACFPDSVIGFIPDEDKADTRFVKYLFDSTIQRRVQQFTQGAAQDNLSQEKLLSIEFAVPGVSEQRRIADVLSAYDNLIANNRRRVALLEDAARQLYREWFVRLRFPGHEHTRISACVPEGWEKVAVGSAFQTVLGGTPSRERSEFWDGGTVPWINSGKVNELRVITASEYMTEQGLSSSAAKLMPRGTTILAITGATLGQVSMLEIEAAANQSVVGIIDPTNLRSEFVYLLMRERIGELVARATGGAQVHINKDIVNAFEVVLPAPGLAALFKEYADLVFRQVAALMFANEKLRAARDLMLPRLMSGEIAV
jgi:type I restriction enzyme S subunit